MRRMGLAAAFWTGPVFFAAAGFSALRYAAHRFRCAAAMRFRAAALMLRFRIGSASSAGQSAVSVVLRTPAELTPQLSDLFGNLRTLLLITHERRSQ
jgi:hypothetical protein